MHLKFCLACRLSPKIDGFWERSVRGRHSCWTLLALVVFFSVLALVGYKYGRDAADNLGRSILQPSRRLRRSFCPYRLPRLHRPLVRLRPSQVRVCRISRWMEEKHHLAAVHWRRCGSVYLAMAVGKEAIQIDSFLYVGRSSPSFIVAYTD